MPEYKIYTLTDTNKITQPPEIVNCGTDEEAIGHANSAV